MAADEMKTGSKESEAWSKQPLWSVWLTWLVCFIPGMILGLGMIWREAEEELKRRGERP